MDTGEESKPAVLPVPVVDPAEVPGEAPTAPQPGGSADMTGTPSALAFRVWQLEQRASVFALAQCGATEAPGLVDRRRIRHARGQLAD